MPVAQPNDIAAEDYIIMFDWLHELSLSDEYAAALKAYRLVTPDTWARYDLYEVTGLKEQQILESTAIKLRKRWKLNRPSFLGRKFKSHDEITDTQPTEETSDGIDSKPKSRSAQRRRRDRKRRIFGDKGEDHADGSA